ncbi:unnamed protein product [Ophioblennius macclurei]
MAADAPRLVGRPAGCLCVLCGLPGAGKSSLAAGMLGAAARRGWRAAAVEYDQLIPDQAFKTAAVEDGVKLEDMHSEWKLHRQAVLQHLEQFLGEPLEEQQSISRIDAEAWERCIKALSHPEGMNIHSAPLLFLLDDNFYYPSMRYEVCQLARKCSLGFCQVYLQCDVESCISRNQSRSTPVPTEVILEMVQRLEPPNPQKNSWEKHSISLNTTENVSECDIQRVMDMISTALSNPLSPAEDNTEQKEADRLKCANSVIHQADQACRRLISDTMKTARENHLSSEDMRSVAAQLNETKATFLQKLRTQILEEMPFMQDEDVNVEFVVKKAVAIFDEKRKEILFGIINNHK